MAQDITLPNEYGKVVKSAEAVGALGTDLFGDQTSLYTGSTEFTVTDVSLPGTGLIPVRLGRRYLVEDKTGIYGGVLTKPPVYQFGDWQLDIPHLHGVFARQWGWISSYDNIYQRCTNVNNPAAAAPPGVVTENTAFAAGEYWHGNNLYVPGAGDQEMLVVMPDNPHKPTDGATYRWVTQHNWYFSCLPSMAPNNGTPGEAFLAIDPNGTRYWFDWAVAYTAPRITKPYGMGPVQAAAAPGVEPSSAFAAAPDRDLGPRLFNGVVLNRDEVWIYPTKIQDRFGNWVTFTYDATVKQRLTKIAASDGRAITLAYNVDGRVVSVSDGTRTWTYGYNAGGTQLLSATLPDASKWQYSLGALKALRPNDSLVEPECGGLPSNPDQVAQSGSITHPSGAVGTFTFKPTTHGRSYVDRYCPGIITENGAVFYAVHPNLFDALSIQSKKITGPGLPAYQWNFVYGPKNESWAQDCGNCASTKTVEVTGPGEWVRYTFSNKFRDGEGKLLKTETGSGPGNILRTETAQYLTHPAWQPYPARIGVTPFTRSDRTAEKYVPQVQRQIVQQGVTFTWRVNQTNGVYSFDAFAHPLSTTRFSSLGHSRTDIATYHHNSALWVIGQLASFTNSNTALVESKTDYDAQALPWKTYAFGKLQRTAAYNADGTLLTLKDGKNNTTTFANWKRDLPQKITFADGKVKAAVVNNIGGIDSVADENGYITKYAYDAMGRLKTIDYTDGDTVNWANTMLSFAPSNVPKYGLPAGHWRQTVSTGNGHQVTYFDALWRPVVQETYDATNSGNTLRQTATRYDAQGRAVFASYPQRNFNAAVYGTWANPAVAPNATGTDTVYDALGRVVTVKADSELGTLTTAYEYLTGFQTRVTNPRGFKTTTKYLAYDQPITDWPMAIVHPEGAYTNFTRDVFGKATSILRHNADNSDWNRRYIAYYPTQEICKTTEVETGTTAYGYDAVGNLNWSATALPWSPATPCEYTSNHVEVVNRRVDLTYDARNRLKTLRFPDGLGDQDWIYTPDGLPETITAYNGAAHTLPVVTAYTYNKRRLLRTETVAQTGWYQWALGYGYNANGHLASHAYPSGLAVSYAPNALGQPTQAGTFATGVSYHPNGAIKQFTYGNGFTHTLTQNLRGLPDTSCDFFSGCPASVLVNDGYDYDANGNVAAISDGTAAHHGNRTMTYDGLDRLKKVVSPMYGTHNANYQYDTLDNLTYVLIGGAAIRQHWYCYDTHQQLTNVKTGPCANGASVMGLGYDERGNLANKNGQGFVFDYGNRLREVTGVEAYRYDALGRRVQAWSPSQGNIFSQDSQAGQLMYQRNGRTSLAYDYVYLNGSLVATREQPLMGGAAAAKYIHTDALGSPVAVTDQNKVVIEKNQYEPFGKEISHPPKDGPGYTGHVLDALTGMMNMQQRYCDPTIGRCLSVDPVTAYGSGNQRFFNRYVYAFNSPYTFKDPDGREGELFWTAPDKVTVTFRYTMGGISPSFTAEQLNAQVAKNYSGTVSVNGIDVAVTAQAIKVDTAGKGVNSINVVNDTAGVTKSGRSEINKIGGNQITLGATGVDAANEKPVPMKLGMRYGVETNIKVALA